MPDPGPRPPRRVLMGWGRTAPTAADVITADRVDDIDDVLATAGRRGTIARGLGRSYGDAAQNAGGSVLDATRLDRVLDVDFEQGVLRVEAGVSLDALMRMLLPRGWFVPVSPGTRFVTVGGALAADIHGKNHHVEGSFANHVLSATLHTPKGVQQIGPDHDAELFWATAGGMGLTGIVSEVTMRLLPVETVFMRVDTERAENLDDVMDRMRTGDDEYRYSGAWIDCMSRGNALGRSVLFRGDHARFDELPPRKRTHARRFKPHTLLTAPWVPDGLALNRFTVAAFNEVFFRIAPREERGRIQPIAPFVHPLDWVSGWNRVYGSRGFVQYQYVVPEEADDTVRQSLELLSDARCASFFAVLKRFGTGNPGLLSFPTKGWTLALDIPTAVRGLASLLDQLDELVAAAGGRVYLAKDSRLRPELLPVMYPQLDQLREVRKRIDPTGILQSDLARRLRLA